MQVAVRKPSKETSIVDIYQALEFRKGCDMPLECSRAKLSEKEGEDIWVHSCTMPPRLSLGGPM